MAIVAVFLPIATSAFGADHYTMDTTHSVPVFEFSHLGMTTQSGRFDRVTGSITLDRVAHQGSIHYEIDATSLNMGFGTEHRDSPGYRLFDVDRHPGIVFDSQELFFDASDNVIAAAGQLTLLGVTKPVNVWVNRFKCSVNPMNKKNVCAANISATIKRSEFGMTDYIPAISDEIKINVPVEAYRD